MIKTHSHYLLVFSVLSISPMNTSNADNNIPVISLKEAIEITLKRNPTILIDAEEVKKGGGELQSCGNWSENINLFMESNLH